MQSVITKLLFTETGTYNDMASRPFETHFDGETMNRFQAATRQGKSVSASGLSAVAASVMRPKAQADGIVSIENSWDTPRLRFMMEVEHRATSMSSHRQILTGYTDYIGVSRGSNAIDPNMKLYFNNTIRVDSSLETSPMGRITRHRVSDASHLLFADNKPRFGFGVNGNNTFTMRPEDVFATSSLGALQGSPDVVDCRVNFGAYKIKKSRRKDGSAPHYMTNIFKARNYAAGAEDIDGGDYTQVMDAARGAVANELLTQDSFLYQLTQRTHFGEECCVTYGELCRMSESVDHVAVVTLRSANATPVHSRGQTEFWTSATMETTAATILGHSVPSLMMDLMLTGISFLATNQTIDGQYMITIHGQQSFAEGMDMSQYLQIFIDRLQYEVLNGLTQNNQITFNLEMYVDILGETHISISMNGQPPVDYVMPSFCDALMTPVITNNRENLENMASDISSLAESLSVEYDYSTNSDRGFTYGNSSAV